MAVRSFKDLIVWQRSINLIDDIYDCYHRLSDFRGQPVVIVFIRGTW